MRYFLFMARQGGCLREEVLAWGRYALPAPQPPPLRGPARFSLVA